MEFLIIVLIIIIVLLSLYLFFINKELKRITRFLKESKKIDSNSLINQEINSKEIKDVIYEINNLLKSTREDKINHEKKTESIKKMMTNISHDLRTPLTSALGYINLIEYSNLKKEEKDHYLKVIEERLKRLEELINSFFEFSCIASNNKEIEFESINIIAILEECIAHYYDDYQSSNRKIIFKNKLKKYNLSSNKEMLKRIFDNLIANALKHSEGNLIIEVEDIETLNISFKNKLIYEDLDIDHIFDEFYTIDISRTKGNTGLGLAIAKEFTENLNGTISAQKEKDNLKILLSFEK